MLRLTLAVYAAIALVRLVTQILLAQWHIVQHRRRKKSLRNSPDSPDFIWPTITVIYPVYNETPVVLREVMQRARKCLEVPEISFIFVDDGSRNRAELVPVYTEFESDRLQIVYQTNGGKRNAQCKGLETATGEYIITVDSDTLIDLQGMKWLVAPLMADPGIGAVCGEILVENTRSTLMTALQTPRYWAAFEMERAAQSVFQSVLCCSGPFSAYRRSILERVQKAYLGQTFFGQVCTYGDDRHLTNLVLSCSYRIVFQPEAVAWTYVPETLPEFARQQNRWNKSFYRELLWTMVIADRVHPYSLIDMMLNPILFLLFTFTLSNYALLQILTCDWRIAFGFLAMVLLGGAIRALYGLVRTGSPLFLLFSLYGLLHVFLLSPLRFKSLLTMADNGWGTRTVKSRSMSRDFGIWATGYVAVILTIAGLIYLCGGVDPAFVTADGMRLAPYSILWRDGIDFRSLALALAGTTSAIAAMVVLAREFSRRTSPGFTREVARTDFTLSNPNPVLVEQVVTRETPRASTFN